MTVASRHGVVSGCVSRQDHDRSAVHQLDTHRSGRRAGRGDAVFGAGLVDFRSFRRRSRRRRRRAVDAARRSVAAGAPGHGRGVCAQRRGARRHRAGAVARPAVGRAAGARTFPASDRCRSRRHHRHRQWRDAMRDRPPHQSAGFGLRRDRRSRLGCRSARADRKRLCGTGAVFMGPHRRASRPSRRDPGIDAGAGRSARRHAAGAGRQTFRYAGAIRRRQELAERRTGQGGSPAKRASAPPSTSRRVRAARTCRAWCGICAPPANSPPD